MFYQIAIRAVNLLWHFWFKLQIFGWENEPKEGGYILASNHCSAIDPMIVCQGIRRVPAGDVNLGREIAAAGQGKKLQLDPSGLPLA